MHQKKNLLFFVSEDWYFCSHRLPLAIAAKKQGYKVTVVTRVRNYGDKIRKSGIKLIPFEQNRRSINIFSLIFTIIQLAYIFYKEQPDIIHNISIKQVVLGSLSAMITRNKNIVSAITGLGWISNKTQTKAKILNYIVTKVLKLIPLGKIIVQNNDDLKWLEAIGINNLQIKLIRGSGVNIFKFKPSLFPKKKFISIVLVSRMLWDKGINEFVQAANILKRSYPKARFILIGEPDYGNPSTISKNQLINWDKNDNVEWHGYKKNICTILKKSCIACLPSYREGLPKFLIEAMASGLPIVTTNVPGCRELVSGEQNGFLVPPYQSKLLAKAIEKLIKNKSIRIKMGNYNRKYAIDNLSEDIINNQTLNLYKEF